MNISDIYNSEWFQSVPVWRAGKACMEFTADGKSCITEYEGCTAETYWNYLSECSRAGFAGGEDYTLGDNLYALRHGAGATVYVSYSAKSGTVRLYAEEKGLNRYPEKGDDGAGESFSPVLWQLPVDSKGSRQNGGMSYVMLTGNGTFVIIDGGYNTEAEADRLYSFLVEHKPEEAEKPVIVAWYFSHLHGDHFGAMYAFSKKYSHEIRVNRFYYHFDYLGNANTDKATFLQETGRNLWKDAIHYGRLHTGMQFCVGGISFRVLYTLEDLYPITAADGIEFNNTSTVLLATVKGQRVMLLGDVMDLASNCMMKYLPTDIFKSDIVQFSHHGYEGGTKELYDAIAAPTVLWPLNVDGYQPTGYKTIPQNVFQSWHKKVKGLYEMPNYYICYEAPYVKKVIPHAYTVRLDFPYTPEGEKLPDAEAIFAEKTAGLTNGIPN